MLRTISLFALSFGNEEPKGGRAMFAGISFVGEATSFVSGTGDDEALRALTAAN